MFSFFGFGNHKIKRALSKGAVIIDVRLPAEFDRGRVPESINIPLDRLHFNIERLKELKQPIVVCCASGTRSQMAKTILKSAGIKAVVNGGSWKKVLKLYNEL